MAGEISPDIMFLGVWQKTLRMGADGWNAVCMGAYGPKDKGEGKNKEKRAPNGRDVDVLWSMHMLKKTRKVVTMGIVLGEGHSEEFGYNKGWAVGNAYVYVTAM